MMAETIRCYIPIPRASATARNRRRAERGRKPREGRGAPEGDRARGRGERRRRGGGHGSDGRRERCRDGAVRARRCARADRGRSDRRLFPPGRRSADRYSGTKPKSAREKIQKPIRSGIAPGHFQRHLSDVLFPPVTDRRLGRCVRCRRNRPLPTTKTGAHEARGKKEQRHRDRGAVERRARTPLRARHGRRSPRVRHSRSPHVSPLRDPARARHRRRVRPPNRARRRLSNAVVIGGVCWAHGFFKPRRGAARARGRDGRALGS